MAQFAENDGFEMTPEQRLALLKIYDRKTDHPERLNVDLFPSYAESGKKPTLEMFINSAFVYPDGTGCIMVKWHGMYLGIERDGHTHS